MKQPNIPPREDLAKPEYKNGTRIIYRGDEYIVMQKGKYNQVKIGPSLWSSDYRWVSVNSIRPKPE